MENDQEFLDVVESMYAPEDVVLDMELEDIYESEQSLLMGDDLSDIIDIIDDVDPEDLDDDGIPDDEQDDDPENDDDDLDEPIESINEVDLFDEFGCINY